MSQDQKGLFIKILRYSTPITLLLLISIGYLYFQDEPLLLSVIGLMIIIETLLSHKAEYIYDYFNDQDEAENKKEKQEK